MGDFPKQSDLFRIARDTALVNNPRLSRSVIERDGTDANILLSALAAAGDEVVSQLISVCAGVFLDSARGLALDRLVFDRYGLLRNAAAPALGSVQFSTTAPNPFSFSIPSGTVLETAEGVQFITLTTVTFPALSIGPITVAVRSTLSGSNQQATIGTITNLVSTLTGSPSDLKVTNVVATAGADDEELDQALRDRARRFFVTARRGTLAAIEAGGLSVPGVRTAKAIEVIDSLGRAARMVQLTVADAFTDQLATLTSVVPSYALQSQTLANTVFSALDDVRAAGIQVQVQVAQIILQPISLALSFAAGSNVDLVALNARSAVVDYINRQPPGTTLSLAGILAVIALVPGVSFTGNEIISPLGNVVAKPLQAIRATLSIVSVVSATADKTLVTTNNPDAFTQV